MGSVFPQTLGIGDMTTNRDAKLTDSTQFIDVFTLKVGNRQIRGFGKGSIVGGVDNRGILYISLKDNTGTPVQLEGKIRLVVRNAYGDQSITILEDLTETFRGSKTDKTTGYMLGLVDSYKAQENSYLVIQYLARDATTAGKTFTVANCDLQLPTTVWTF